MNNVYERNSCLTTLKAIKATHFVNIKRYISLSWDWVKKNANGMSHIYIPLPN